MMHTPDMRIVTCTICNGDGGGEALPDGPWDFRWVECTPCGGNGEVEVEFLPITQDDLCGEDDDEA